MSEPVNARDALTMIADQLRLEAAVYGARLSRGAPVQIGTTSSYQLLLTLEIAEPVGPPLGPPLPLGVQVSDAIQTEDRMR